MKRSRTSGLLLFLALLGGAMGRAIYNVGHQPPRPPAVVVPYPAGIPIEREKTATERRPRPRKKPVNSNSTKSGRLPAERKD